MESFLISVGLTPTTANALTSLSPFVAFFTGVGLLMLKFWLAPAFGKYVAQKTDDARAVLDSVHSISESLKEQNKAHSEQQSSFNRFLDQTDQRWSNVEPRVTSIQEGIALLISENINSLDERTAIKMFHKHINEHHLRLFNFFKTRCIANHYHDNVAIIKDRYKKQAQRMSGQSQDFLNDFTFKGENTLAQFWGFKGCDMYYDHVTSELFTIQALYGTDKFLWTDDDIMNALDRNLSRLLTGFTHWLKTKETLTNQMDSGKLSVEPMFYHKDSVDKENNKHIEFDIEDYML